MLLLFLSVAIFLIDFSFWLFTEYKRSSKNTFAFFPFPFLLKLWYLPTDGEARTNVRTTSVDNWRLRAERYGEIVSLYLLVSLIWFLFLTLSLLISVHIFDKLSDTDLQVKIIFQLVSNIKGCSEKSHYNFQLKICLSHTCI